MDVYVRNAQYEDLSKISKLYEQLHEHHLDSVPQNTPSLFNEITIEDFNTVNQDEYIFSLVLCTKRNNKEHVVGTALVRIINEGEGACSAIFPYMYINQFVIGKEYRNMRLGSYFISNIKTIATRFSCHEVYLDCWTENYSGSAFYLKHEFSPVRQLLVYKRQ
ncbi:GNAT family N-acetyltransferase [Vibrio sp. ZSDZ65]|uniref:GNAT family N-acetyltransferase n=1 Tax=Vibrio qingdaonensis TaxID=2829491 RepID=A0A9X3CR78_9VIBR|nr:GNAT family N-acetyltransferase [Vibrio qingdaonensis]MCW8347920.1 GNAT family N-acetyltransferase [Vibrio qingdaonensis]